MMPISNGVLLSFIFLLSVSSTSSLVFSSPAQKQSFKRPDPLSHFKAYHGGFNIKNKHYWASTAFTGIHGYAMAGIWILGGLGFGIYVIVKNHYGSSSSAIKEHSNSHYLIPFMVVVLCTFLAIVASSFVFAASHNSLLRAQKLKHTILRTAKQARQTIRKVTVTMHEMQNLLRPYNEVAYRQLKLTSTKLQKESNIIRKEVHDHQHEINQSINIWYGTSVGLVSINLIFVVAGLAFLFLHWRPGFIMVIVFCWILTALCWILTGFEFFIHTFAEDICSAFKEFQQNPGNNSLSSVLPCESEENANRIMAQIGSTVYNFIDKMNSKITSFGRILGLNEQGDASTNVFWQICNPFAGPPNFNYIPNGCPPGTIPVNEVPNVLAKFTCYKENSTLSCAGKFVPEKSYNMAWAYSESIQNLLDIIPDLQNLTKCSFVRDTLSDVLLHHCTPFRVSFKMLWSAMIALSITMVVLELAWITKAYQNKGRNFSRFSVIPKVSGEGNL